jgi:replicative DNA helicase
MAAADHGAVSIISLEMSREELGGMMLAKAANVSYQAIRDPSKLDGDWSQITEGLA